MGLTLLGFDACLEGMAEVAYEHRDDAQLMIASPEMEGAWGWDWTQVFTQFGQSADHSALNFVRIVVDTYMALSLSELDEYATLAVYDLSRMDELATAATDMAAAITPLSDTDFYAICDTLDWYGCDGPDCEDYVDLTQLATQAAVVDPTNASTYNAVSAAVAQAVIYEAHATAHPDSHGMNVYFPCYYYPWDEYADVTWAIDTGWGPMVLAH